jgi:hypothetical protein
MSGGKPFAVIDTENGRALHYADMFKFDCARFSEPFRPGRYAEMIADADKAGYPVIVVDQASHEHAGPGGILDWHEEELAAFVEKAKQRPNNRDPDWKLEERYKMQAWIQPKIEHKHRFIGQLLKTKAHLILCLRAEEKIKIGKDNSGRTKIEPADFRSATPEYASGVRGWAPICEKNVPFELTMSCLMLPEHPGVPIPIKLQAQHRAFVSLDKPIDRATGEAFAQWARGVESQQHRVVEPVEQSDRDVVAELLDAQSKERLDALVKDIINLKLDPETTQKARAAFAKRRNELTAKSAARAPDREPGSDG